MLAGVPGPRPGADVVGERAHPVQHGVHVGHHVLAVHHERRVAGQAQRGVQYGPVLAGVDALPGEHRLGALGQAGAAGQRGQQRQGVPGDAVLGVVE
jgi:hypothetical protein